MTAPSSRCNLPESGSFQFIPLAQKVRAPHLPFHRENRINASISLKHRPAAHLTYNFLSTNISIPSPCNITLTDTIVPTVISTFAAFLSVALDRASTLNVKSTTQASSQCRSSLQPPRFSRAWLSPKTSAPSMACQTAA